MGCRSSSPLPDEVADDNEPSPRRIATVLAVVLAVQVLAMLVIVAGAVVLMATLAHNNSLDCSSVAFPGQSAGCTKHSYALAIGLLAGGFGLFLAGMVTSATYAMRHVGAPVLSAVALSLRRRRAE